MPSKTRGIYALIHKPSKSIYIGSTCNIPNRIKKWKIEIAFDPQELPKAFPRSPIEDWDFQTIKEYPETATVQDMLEGEHEFIRRLQERNPDRCLNRKSEAPKKIEFEGQVCTLGEIARKTGLSSQLLSWRYRKGMRGAELVAKPRGA